MRSCIFILVLLSAIGCSSIPEIPANEKLTVVGDENKELAVINVKTKEIYYRNGATDSDVVDAIVRAYKRTLDERDEFMKQAEKITPKKKKK